MNEAAFVLYATSACHLCELAEAVLATLPLAEPLAIDWVDISGDDGLMARYGTKIPVLTFAGEGSGAVELVWPFSAEQALDFIRGCDSSLRVRQP